jgi:hypothetical protein
VVLVVTPVVALVEITLVVEVVEARGVLVLALLVAQV